uniref:16S rRNA (guanine(527)-N(7))-methyltransferase RsmG n=1 Tax=Staphylococcus aureus TaxID=1280 RepID=UPI00351E33DB
ILISLYIVIGFSIYMLDVLAVRVGLIIMVIIQTAVLFTFLNHLASELQLQDVSFIHDRAETFGKGVYRESYDVVTARAVDRLSVLSELCLPLVKKGGQFVALKSSKGEEELEEDKLYMLEHIQMTTMRL